MAYTVEGNDAVGFRVLDEDGNALTGRKGTEQEALDVAGVKKAPARSKNSK